MNTISLRMNDEDTKLFQTMYLWINWIWATYQRVDYGTLEEEFELDEARIYMLKWKEAKWEEVWPYRSLGDVTFNHVQVEFSESAVKALKKLDRHTARKLRIGQLKI